MGKDLDTRKWETTCKTAECSVENRAALKAEEASKKYNKKHAKLGSQKESSIITDGLG